MRYMDEENGSGQILYGTENGTDMLSCVLRTWERRSGDMGTLIGNFGYFENAAKEIQ